MVPCCLLKTTFSFIFMVLLGEAICETTVEIEGRINPFRDGVFTCYVINMPQGGYVEWSAIKADGSAEVIKNQTRGRPSGYMRTRFWLYIPEFSPAEEGEYKCSVFGEGIENPPSDQMYLEYKESPEIKNFPWRPRVVAVGQDVQITCEATGVPPPSFTWKKDGDDSFESQGPVLHLPSAKFEDSGRYSCIADNGFSEDRRWMTIEVKFYAADVMTDTTSVTGHVGSDVEIKVRVDGRPLPSVSLYKEGDMGSEQRINFDYQKYFVYGKYVNYRENSFLKEIRFVIKNVDQDDSGTYICKAYNRYGGDEEKIIVTVF